MATVDGWTLGNPEAVEAVATVFAFVAAGFAVGIEMRNSRRLAEEIAARAAADEREHASYISMWPEPVLINSTDYQNLVIGNTSTHAVTNVIITDTATPPDPSRVLADETVFTATVFSPVPKYSIAMGRHHAMPSGGNADRYVMAFTDRNGIRWERLGGGPLRKVAGPTVSRPAGWRRLLRRPGGA